MRARRNGGGGETMMDTGTLLGECERRGGA